MSDSPRFVHRVLASGEHCVYAPDVKGLGAVAATENEARREALNLLEQFRDMGATIEPRR